MHNDLPGVCGVSPYEVVFGRVRPLPGAPILPRLHAIDAKEFFRRRREIDQKLQVGLTKLHHDQTARFNLQCRRKSCFCAGDLVWVLRPRTIGTNKLKSWWLGPCPIRQRLGDLTYEVEIKPGAFICVHRAQMKAFVHDPGVACPASHQYLLTQDEEDELGEAEPQGAMEALGEQEPAEGSAPSTGAIHGLVAEPEPEQPHPHPQPAPLQAHQHQFQQAPGFLRLLALRVMGDPRDRDFQPEELV